MKSRLGQVFALSLTVGAGSAIAQQPQLTPEQAIQFLDKDADGKCSLNEYLTFQVGRIAQFDRDADTFLQFEEFKESLSGDGKRNARRSFDAFNKERMPNALTDREFLGYHAYVFQNYVDLDRDGFMSAEEWSKVVAKN